MNLYSSDFKRIIITDPLTSKDIIIERPIDIDCVELVGDREVVFTISYLDEQGFLRRITCYQNNTRFVREDD
jgi:hypothetical protein